MSGTVLFTHSSQGRDTRNVLVLCVVWAILLWLYLYIDAAWWIVGGLALFTLPLVWEIAVNPQNSLTLTDKSLGWQAGRASDTIPLSMIAKIRFDTRLDLSVKITLTLADSRKIRLPHAAVPPHREFETALKNAGIQTERHHFSFL